MEREREYEMPSKFFQYVYPTVSTILNDGSFIMMNFYSAQAIINNKLKLGDLDSFRQLGSEVSGSISYLKWQMKGFSWDSAD